MEEHMRQLEVEEDKRQEEIMAKKIEEAKRNFKRKMAEFEKFG